MAGSQASSRTPEPTGSYEDSAPSPLFQIQECSSELVDSNVVRELACEPAMFQDVGEGGFRFFFGGGKLFYLQLEFFTYS